VGDAPNRQARHRGRLAARWRRTLRAAALGLLALGCATIDGPRGAPRGEVTASSPARAGLLAVGDAVPDFTAPDLRGGVLRWQERGERPIALVVWASWCPHCGRLLPAVVRVAPEFPGVQVVTVATSVGRHPGPSPEEVMERHHLLFPSALDDEDNTLGRALGVQRYPTIYWVGPDGRIRGVSEGEAGDDWLRQAFRQLLADSSPGRSPRP
jgi:peroxiredoxin